MAEADTIVKGKVLSVEDSDMGKHMPMSKVKMRVDESIANKLGVSGMSGNVIEF